MTDLERLVVAWDVWRRTCGATTVGFPIGPLAVGVVVAAAMISVSEFWPALR